ncbi:MAG TPA: phosphoribosylamine--glycine ligase [Cytophagales bacterium]|nr:phosphoribosylamine--glycine ligase [Cytophagales bacterium]
MNILLIGSGGREHALAWKLAQSSKCDKLFLAPGNPGTENLGINTGIGVEDFSAIENLVLKENIGMVVVGPEVPLVMGIKDHLLSNPALSSLNIIGPDKMGAQLEGSKDFSKKFMNKYGIPTASSRTFTFQTLNDGVEYVSKHSLPVVLKADGLAAGKGVVIAQTNEEAVATLKEMIQERKFGDSSTKVVVEQFLTGIEVSVFALCDGENYLLLPEAKDYKRIGEGDTGLNTGGMGAVSPVPFVDEIFMQKVEERIVRPTVSGLKKEGINYTGFIFFGLIKVGDEPFTIEYNARMGDPETEAVIPRIKSDLVDIFEDVGTKTLHKTKLEIDSRTTTTVVLVSGGYPEDYEKGFSITGIENAQDVLVFHAGTSKKEGKLVNSGGRVIALTAFGSHIEEALAKANLAADTIQWQKKNYRKDIGLDLLKK